MHNDEISIFLMEEPNKATKLKYLQKCETAT